MGYLSVIAHNIVPILMTGEVKIFCNVSEAIRKLVIQ